MFGSLILVGVSPDLFHEGGHHSNVAIAVIANAQRFGDRDAAPGTGSVGNFGACFRLGCDRHVAKNSHHARVGHFSPITPSRGRRRTWSKHERQTAFWTTYRFTGQFDAAANPMPRWTGHH